MQRPRGWGISIQPQGTGDQAAGALLELLKPLCYHNWSIRPFAVDAPVTFAPSVYSAALLDELAVAEEMAQRPGNTWLLLNEPERPEQAAMTPWAAMTTTQEFLSVAWAEGEEFQWAAPGVSVTTADYDGLEWLTEYVKLCRRRCGIQRPSYWHIHMKAPSGAAFSAAWQRFENWWITWGAGAPVIISEVCAQNAALSEQVSVMEQTDGLLISGHVAAAFWFTASPSTYVEWPNAALATVAPGGRAMLTPTGTAWMNI